MSRDITCATCEAVRIMTGQGTTEIVAIAVKLRKPPAVILRHLVEQHERHDLAQALTDQGRPLRIPEPDPRSLQVFCPDCDALLAENIGTNGRDRAIAALRAQHTCPTPKIPSIPVTRPEETTVTSTPIPSAQDLLTHPDKRVARQAAKVIAEQAKLVEAWKADQGRAELRAKRDRLKAQLAKIEAELRGASTTAPVLPSKEIRAWAAGNGVPCPVTGKIPGSVVDAWKQATSERAS